MRRYRQKYYDLFSNFYDLIIKLHSKDNRLFLRHYLARKSGIKPSDAVLDLCTGTGELALVLAHYAFKGRVIGLDFSLGMLNKAKEKAQKNGTKNLFFVAGDAAHLPFKEGVFDVVTCSHAMYELSGKTRPLALREIKRCLKSKGLFCMMEHEEPKQPFIRLLYYIRLLSMGKEGRKIIRNELKELKGIFNNVIKEVTSSGKTKVICGQKIG